MFMKMIGSNHLEIRGSLLLESLLNKHEPESITIEFPSNYSINEIEELILSPPKVDYLQLLDMPDNLKKLLVEFHLNRGYDALVPIRYAQNRGMDVYPVDYPDVAKILMSQKNKEITQEKFNAKLKNIPLQIWQMTYDKFREQFIRETDNVYFNRELFDVQVYSALIDLLFFDKQIQNIQKIFEPEFAERREEYMAQRILDINPDMHIGGAIHIFESYSQNFPVKQLYRRLEEENILIKKIQLYEAVKYS